MKHESEKQQIILRSKEPKNPSQKEKSSSIIDTWWDDLRTRPDVGKSWIEVEVLQETLWCYDSLGGLAQRTAMRINH